MKIGYASRQEIFQDQALSAFISASENISFSARKYPSKRDDICISKHKIRQRETAKSQ